MPLPRQGEAKRMVESEGAARGKGRQHKVGNNNLSGGSGSGYATDGKDFWIAPNHSTVIADLEAEEYGLTQLQRNTDNYVAETYTVIRKRYQHWWDTMTAELGLDHAKNTYTYSRIERRIITTPKKTDDQEANK